MNDSIQLYRGDIFYFKSSCVDDYVFLRDGALLVSAGKVVETGKYDALKKKFPEAVETDCSGRLIMPGFIDSHIHYAQSEIVGMYGKQLLDWLNEYTFPAELEFRSSKHAEYIADVFIKELLKNGTTTCVAYSTVHKQSVDALFKAASDRNMRIITGKVLMERNAMPGLADTVEDGERDSRELIERWHRVGRNHYAITPRFAITCSEEQLVSAGRIHADYPDTYVQTHLSENKHEIEYTLSLFPGCKDYLEVYERAGLITERAVLGHCIYLSDSELSRISSEGAVIAHCPTSNLFLGSGLFDMERANKAGAKTVLATDVGGGTSFSMLKTMGESYKVMQLNGYSVSVFETLYKSTFGAAKALHLDDKIGSFLPGMEADFIVVDYAATSAQQIRKDYLERTGKWNIETALFGLQISGDDRNIVATYIMGKEYKNLSNL